MIDLQNILRFVVSTATDDHLAAAARQLPDEVLAGMLRDAMADVAGPAKAKPVKPVKPAKPAPTPKAKREAKSAAPPKRATAPGFMTLSEAGEKVKEALGGGKELGCKAIAEATGLDHGRASRAVSWLAAAGVLASRGTRGTRQCVWRLA